MQACEGKRRSQGSETDQDLEAGRTAIFFEPGGTGYAERRVSTKYTSVQAEIGLEGSSGR